MNLLELAQQELTTRDQWPSGEDVVIWQNGNRRAYIKNEDGWLTMALIKESDRLSHNKISQPLPVGYYDPQHGLWVESESAIELYPHWVEQTRRLMGA